MKKKNGENDGERSEKKSDEKRVKKSLKKKINYIWNKKTTPAIFISLANKFSAVFPEKYSILFQH